MGVGIAAIQESAPGVSTGAPNTFTAPQTFGGGTSTSGSSTVDGQSVPSATNPPPSGVLPTFPPSFSTQPSGNFSSFATSGPTYDICAGPDGNIWFTESTANRVGKVTPSGTVTEYAIPTASAGAAGICAGPDGNLWFVENATNKIGKVTPAGVITEYALPGGITSPVYICAGPDGNLWFSANGSSQIVRITPSGVFTGYNTQTPNSRPWGICVGPDGRIWAVYQGAGKVGALNISTGAITEYAVSVPSYLVLEDICAGPDGNVWFTMNNVTAGTGEVGVITPTGTVTTYNVPTASPSAIGICAGPDGNLWFAETAVNKLSSLTTRGAITEYTPSTVVKPYNPCAGPDGNIWFTEQNTAAIGRLNMNATFGNVQTVGYVYQKGANLVFTNPANPTGTTSSSPVMMGLAIALTPQFSGRVKVHIVVTGQNNTLNDGLSVQPYYGTGAAPANGAAATGTAFAMSKSRTAIAAGEQSDLSWVWELTGLAVGTALWFDVALNASTGGTASLLDIMVWLEEF